MDTDLGMPIINKEPIASFEESLASYTKSILFKIGETAHASLKKSHKKDQLAEELKKILLSRLEEDSVLPEKDWKLLQELAADKVRTIERDDLSIYSTLTEHGYAFVFQRGMEMKVAVPEEVIQAVRAGEDVQETKELNKHEMALLKLYESTKAIYGTVNLTHLVKVWNDYHDVQFSIDDIHAIVQGK